MSRLSVENLQLHQLTTLTHLDVTEPEPAVEKKLAFKLFNFNLIIRKSFKIDVQNEIFASKCMQNQLNSSFENVFLRHQVFAPSDAADGVNSAEHSGSKRGSRKNKIKI